MEPRTDAVLMLTHNTVIAPNTEKNIIKIVTKKHKDKLHFKSEGTDEGNVKQGKQNR
jgi:hypothetical protein